MAIEEMLSKDGGCCWTPQTGYLVGDNPLLPWALPTGKWVDMWGAVGDISVLHSQTPDWINSGEALAFWVAVSGAVRQYVSNVSRIQRWHHRGQPEMLRAYRTDLTSRQGGLVPVLFFSFPDYYIQYHKPLIYQHWRPSGTYSYGYDDDLIGNVINEVKGSDAYLSEYKTWRDGTGIVDSGMPLPITNYPDPSTEEVDIYLRFVDFEDVLFAGGSRSFRVTFLSNMGGLLELELRADWARKTAWLAGFPTPAVMIKDADIRASGFNNFDYVQAAKTATPEAGLRDRTIPDYVNRLKPLSKDQDLIFKLYINGNLLLGPDGELIQPSEWSENDMIHWVYDHLKIMPVQEWSAPDSFQKRMEGSGG
jgi:hypothetical protein